MKLPVRSSLLSKPFFDDWLSRPPLEKKFYLQDTLAVAQQLLGKGLVVISSEGAKLAEIVEVEAYLGSQDPASHAYRGPSPRNKVMFEEGGLCYVYLCYGMYYCMNVVTGKKGEGEAVLLRAAQPLFGFGVPDGEKGLRTLCNGPGKLTRALGIDRRHDGRAFNEEGLRLIDLGRKLPRTAIGASPRIGISKAVDFPWRFFNKNSPWLSRKR